MVTSASRRVRTREKKSPRLPTGPPRLLVPKLPTLRGSGRRTHWGQELSAVARNLLGWQGDAITIELADKAFEWDLALAGNWEPMLDALQLIKPRVSNRLRKELASCSSSPSVQKGISPLDLTRTAASRRSWCSTRLVISLAPYRRLVVSWMT
jgi:hypothetical protein